MVGWSGPSSPVTTQTTPGSFSASEVSMLLMMPWGMGLPRILPYTMPRGWMSVVYSACPVTLSRASWRISPFPME